MSDSGARPSVVLICHEGDRIDREGLTSWLASTLDLVGVVILKPSRRRLVRTIRREIRRVGFLRFLDVVAFRVYYRLFVARADAAWIALEVARLRATYPADLSRVPRIVAANPNRREVRRFIEGLQPDLIIARCKFILKREIFDIPRRGTFALHPGICPEYRNAHGCFWALVRRDLERVGMTLLRIDEGVDTGPVYLHATCGFDEVRESHIVIQYRVVLENLNAIRVTLVGVRQGTKEPILTGGRPSGSWGHPWFSAYLRWKRQAKRAHAGERRFSAFP
jgi:folate-dependent phosphoribosylglycinamide formyltransferase PurN